MIKPLLVEIMVIAVAALGYLTQHLHAGPPAAPSAGFVLAKAQRAQSGAGQPGSAESVMVATPVQRSVADSIPISGKLSLDQQEVHIAFTRVSGRLGRIFVSEGQSVKAGEALAEIHSPEYLAAEQELLRARPVRDSAAYQAAANKLKLLGAAEEDLERLSRGGQVEEYLKVRAPVSGVVTQRNVDPGGHLNAGDALMSLARLDTLWLVANTYDRDYGALKLGQSLSFQSASLPGREFDGQVAFIAPGADPATHTLPIRCNVPNPGLLLRPEMFVRGELKVGERSAWMVPKTAVIHIRDTDYVVVRDDQHHYRRLAVQGHAVESGEYAITGGLDRALPVVSDGGLLIDELVSGS